MAKRKWYGSISNRLEEGHIYNEDGLIHEGDDINMYYYSDVTCYFITKVIDQKHIFVHRYEVCADHSKPGGMGHQDWLYFKTIKEEKEYLKKFFPDTNTENIVENTDEEWVFRYGSWKRADRFTQTDIDNFRAKNHYCMFGAKNEKEQALLDAGKEVVHYQNLSGKVSFGKDIRSYYYDWEF